LAIIVVLASSKYYTIGMRIPGLRTILDKQLVNKLAGLLESYGHADFITDAKQYKLAPAD
jgi:hypothetical protein